MNWIFRQNPDLRFPEYFGEENEDDDNNKDDNEDAGVHARPKDVANDLTTGDGDQQKNKEGKGIYVFEFHKRSICIDPETPKNQANF